MVNKDCAFADPSQKICFTVQASWMGSWRVAVIGLAHHLLHHRGKLDGVGSAAIVSFHAKESKKSRS
jgi:hypothetical protein